jgi:2-dehydro-3-deoxygluconokinase
MLELAKAGDEWRLGYGGDTLNTAIHLARLGHKVRFLTALGGDPFSDGTKSKWEAEGIDCSLVLTDPARHLGLYAVSTDADGERSFTYWREASAARGMFTLPESERALAEAARADVLYFSLITLAILPPAGRAALLTLAGEVRAAGGRVAFDSNYRPRLWSDPAEASAARYAAVAVADIGLPTLEDEAALGGSTDACELTAEWCRIGCRETVVKLGANGCLLPDCSIIAPNRVVCPVDTSGAGDAFNAGYLDARLAGASPQDAARAGHALAAWTIMRPGAIPAADS